MSDYFTGSFTSSSTATLWVDTSTKDRLVTLAISGGSINYGFSSTSVAMPLQFLTSYATQVATATFVLPAGQQVWGSGGVTTVGVLVTKSNTMSICS